MLGTSEHDGLISRARRIKVRGHTEAPLHVVSDKPVQVSQFRIFGLIFLQNIFIYFHLCVQDFEALQGRADSKTAFYEALSRSLGGVTGSDLLKDAAAWFYSLDHSPSAAGYNLFSRALNNATRSDNVNAHHRLAPSTLQAKVTQSEQHKSHLIFSILGHFHMWS